LRFHHIYKFSIDIQKHMNFDRFLCEVDFLRFFIKNINTKLIQESHTNSQVILYSLDSPTNSFWPVRVEHCWIPKSIFFSPRTACYSSYIILMAMHNCSDTYTNPFVNVNNPIHFLTLTFFFFHSLIVFLIYH
jgi:hypothetical protein